MGLDMAGSYRLERLNESIKELLSEMLMSRIKDPRIGFVTITSVEVASDLLSAKVYFSVMGDKEKRLQTESGLKSAKNYMRKTITKELKIRYAPELRFIYDDSLDKAMGIEEALKEIRKKEKGKP